MNDRATRGASPATATFRPDRLGLAPTLLVLVGTLPLAGTARPLLLLLLLPVGIAVWILRAKVVVRPGGLLVGNGLGAVEVPWEQVEGFDLTGRGPVRLLEQGGHRRMLTALGRRRVPLLLRAAEQAQGVSR